MKYGFNIDKWVNIVSSSMLRTVNRIKILQAHLRPIQTLSDAFATFRTEVYFKTRYSSQQKVLSALLNKLFDPTHKRIRVVTSSDIKPLYYQFYTDEINADLKYSFYATEVNPVLNYGYFALEYINAYRFVVRIPSECDTDVIRTNIKAWVNYYRFASLNFIIEII